MVYAQRCFQARAGQSRTQNPGTHKAPYYPSGTSRRHRACAVGPSARHQKLPIPPCHLCPAGIGLYCRRWAVENHYRDEKVGFGAERFHGKTVTGVQQALFAIPIVCVIARTITALPVPPEAVETGQCRKAPQLKKPPNRLPAKPLARSNRP
ncbi:MAG: hypothetical protein PHR16_16825 [Methylovulum sp.]|nr:hypothetical protein [Methylovulum sp.]